MYIGAVYMLRESLSVRFNVLPKYINKFLSSLQNFFGLVLHVTVKVQALHVLHVSIHVSINYNHISKARNIQFINIQNNPHAPKVYAVREMSIFLRLYNLF